MSEDGTWMTIRQIKEAGSTYCIATLYSKVTSDTQFETRRARTQGKPIEVLVTSENISRFRIRKKLDFTKIEPLEQGVSEVIVHTISGDYPVSSGDGYGSKYFSEVMRGILPKSVSSKEIEELFVSNAKHEGQSKKIDGSRLIGLALESKKAKFLDSNLFNHLSGEAGINLDEVAPALQRAARGYIKKLSPNLPYICRTDLPEVVKLIRKEIYGVDDWPEEVDLKGKNEKTGDVQESSAKEETAEKATTKSAEPNNRFYIEVPGILGGTRICFETGSKQIHVRDVRTKPSGIEVIVDTEETITTEKSASDHGKWCTASQLSEITRLHIATIRTKLKKYEKELSVRRRQDLGRAYEAKITLDNYNLIGLTKEKARQLFNIQEVPESTIKKTTQKHDGDSRTKEHIKQETAQEQPVVIDISGKNYEFVLSKIYEPKEIYEILKQVHAGVFTPLTVDKILEELKSSLGLEGRKLADYIKSVNGMMDLSSTGTKLRLQEIGASVENLKTDPELSQYLRSAQGLREQYILRADLPQIQKAVSERKSLTRGPVPVTGPDREASKKIVTDSDKKEEEARQTAFYGWTKRLEKKSMMPEDLSLEKLTSSGVLITNTKESINLTFGAFEREMEGFRFFNLDRIRRGIPGEPGWREFYGDYLPKLLEAGIIKNIAQSCGGPKNSHFYVIKKGKYKEDAFEVLGIKPDSTE
ncbi:hypothetical protein A3K73_06425 [Candidatus Pacearchaeota archaeon RBG_13_36_9]|nr:MAG: hypothetical protein A3K73_06425 [Candidatus Pacearchaeota archaeon RBG_13_36_9]